MLTWEVSVLSDLSVYNVMLLFSGQSTNVDLSLCLWREAVTLKDHKQRELFLRVSWAFSRHDILYRVKNDHSESKYSSLPKFQAWDESRAENLAADVSKKSVWTGKAALMCDKKETGNKSMKK